MSRITVIEQDRSGFTNTLVDETGAMVVNSAKGKKTPMYLQSEEDCLRELGTPSAAYPGVFEAVAFTKTAPLWCVSAVASDALYGGIDVGLTSVVGFGVGRDYSTFNYGTTTKGAVYTSSSADGATATFSGTIVNTPIVDNTSFVTKINGVVKAVTMDSGGNLTGTDVTAGSVNLSTGYFTITYAGSVGTYAVVTTTVDGSSNYDLSSGSTDKYITITIDDSIQTINLGQSATTTRAAVISAINTAFGFTAATTNGTNYISITGRKGSTLGQIIVEAPSTGDSALSLVFSSTGLSLTDSGSNPTGAIPTYGSTFTFDYHYTINSTTSVSHSFFTTSPYADDLAASVKFVSGSKFILTLYKKTTTGYALLNTYNYSLIREKDASGKSLYYEDVFNQDKYVLFKLNTAFTEIAYVLPGTSIVDFSGGTRGGTPLTADYITAWNQFQYANKYRAKIFMDVYGTNAVLVNSLIQNYQSWAQGITCIPMGYTPTQGLTYRSGLGIDSDDIALYHNWAKIEDIYNNGYVWISHVGSIGRKYALMNDVWDAASPAGIDENNHGGLISDWTVIEVENDFTQAYLDSYYNAQINPLIWDDAYGLLAYGDNTMQVTSSDTSFIGTRRVYKYITDTISRQILRKQEFKLNDALHRLMAQTQIDEFLSPIKANGWLRDYRVICDTTNNTDVVLNNRQFVVDLLVQVGVNSQWVYLKLTRLAQGVKIESVEV